MTAQQINLYRPGVESAPLAFSTDLLLRASVGIAVAFGLYWGFVMWQATRLTTERDVISIALGAERTRVEAMAAKLAVRSHDTSVESEVSALRRQIRARADVLTRLSEKGGANDRGFSMNLEGLARSRVDGLWLDSIRLGAGGRSLELAGYALLPERVPQLLRALGQEPAFSGQEFQFFRMSQETPDAPAIAFEISTEGNLP